MKRTIRFIGIFVIIICFISIITVYGNKTTNANDTMGKYTEIMKAQEGAKEAYEKLIATFYTDGQNIKYPDEYAGAYINDYNQLVIRLTAGSEDKIKEYENLLKGYNCIEIIDDADYSFNYLNEVESMYETQINDLLPTSYGIDPISNSLVIKIPSNSLSEASSIFNAGNLNRSSQNNSNPISIVEDNDYQKTETTNLVGGDVIIHNGYYFTLSIGGSAYGSKAILFNGHFTAPGYEVDTASGTRLGTLAAKQFSNNQVGDYSIATVNSDFNTTNLVKGSSQNFAITGTYNNPPVGTLLYKYGGTSGIAAVTVTGTNQSMSVVSDGTTYVIKGMTNANITSGSSAGGDSGGPYYSWYNNGWAYSGVHSASDSTSVSFTPLINITGFSVKTN